MSHDIQTKQCKVCNELKQRISAGIFKARKGKRWVDDEGKLWNGLVCPDCHRKRSLVNMHRLRSKDKNETTI